MSIILTDAYDVIEDGRGESKPRTFDEVFGEMHERRHARWLALHQSIEKAFDAYVFRRKLEIVIPVPDIGVRVREIVGGRDWSMRRIDE
jgi:hypothetical protein